MADNPEHPHHDTLAPPRKSVELEDPGAHELSSENEEENDEDVFSDAQEDPTARSGQNSPIPITRVEKVDDSDSHGEIPGTEAYNQRLQDAVPDELEVVGDTSKPSRRNTQSQPNRTATPGGTPIPMTVVEKVDATSPSHGDVPGTAAHSMRKADAVPDMIVQSPKAKASFGDDVAAPSMTPEISVPKTVVTKVDEEPSHGEVPGTEAFDMRTEDATPDVVETKGDVRGLPTSSNYRSSLSSPKPRPPAVRNDSQIAADGGFGPMPDEEDESSDSESDASFGEHKPTVDDTFGDDFDEFEAGGEDEDFGDFDDDFAQPPSEPVPPKSEPTPVSKSQFPCLSFDAFTAANTLSEAMIPQLNALFPKTQSQPLHPPPQPAGPPPSLFLTPRSHSLFTQLIAPPPLNPPNWLRSRTRRLFLVSLGVPIDLDEILPKSKQKKLVLPSTIRSDSEHRRSESRQRRIKSGDGGGVRDLKEGGGNASTTSLSGKDRDSSKRKHHHRKGGDGKDQLAAHPPPFDASGVRQLCATTGVALEGMTDQEVKAHVQRLEEMTRKAGEVLEYWVRRRDAAMREKEMFESVVGDLVKHARRVRR
ncbi:MAG: hypothetical protein Q9220_002718 [cf. Caloplaca sp. 1 TL-2023]